MLSRLVPCAIFLLTAGVPLQAQAPTPTPGQVRQLQQVAQQAMNPAAAALAYQQELALTGEQTALLLPLSDRMGAVVERIMDPRASATQMRLAQALTDASVPVDEDVIRKEYCQQATAQADLMIEMIRTQREVDRILTSEQRQRIQTLRMSQAFEMMRMFSDPTAAP